jgi:hypothetical protein
MSEHLAVTQYHTACKRRLQQRISSLHSRLILLLLLLAVVLLLLLTCRCRSISVGLQQLRHPSWQAHHP